MYRLFGSNSESKEPQSPEQSITPEFRQKVVQVFALVGEAIAEATHALLASDRELAKRSSTRTWSSTVWSTRWC